jgi:tetratricopeptide (TPR) repeat protein
MSAEEVSADIQNPRICSTAFPTTLCFFSLALAPQLKAKGNAAQQAGDFDEAIDYYTQAIELNNKNHVYYSNRSAAYLSKGDAAKALQDAEECIKVSTIFLSSRSLID